MRREILDNLPIFAAESELGLALLGVRRAEQWTAIVPILERRGFPKIDREMGGRYVPAVKAFFDREYGLATLVPKTPDGPERLEVWNKNRKQQG